MPHDIFFDCPQCNHTIKVSSDLVGNPVECPDCANEIFVPDIRDGINPRFRSPNDTDAPLSSKTVADLKNDLEHLGAGLRSIVRRQKEQIKQTDFLEGNCNLIYKQLTMLELKSPVADETALNVSPQYEAAHSPSSPRNWIKWSIAFSLSSLGTAVVVALLLVQSS
jgi:DNA-directed RNA polymerase subunit RPC12/RpoP